MRGALNRGRLKIPMRLIRWSVALPKIYQRYTSQGIARQGASLEDTARSGTSQDIMSCLYDIYIYIYMYTCIGKLALPKEAYSYKYIQEIKKEAVCL